MKNLQRVKAEFRKFFSRSVRSNLGVYTAILCVVLLVLPSGFSVESPGPTRDVLSGEGRDAIIRVTGAKTYESKGKLLLVTVNAAGIPGYPVTNAEALWQWASPHATVLPREAVVPVGTTSEEYEKETKQEMTSSQDAAQHAAFNWLKAHNISTAGAKVTMHVDDIGGPSAGMMYTLGLIDKFTSEDETGGLTIAGTGTMSDDGSVGAIGGIRLKMLGAKRDGATWFLAPSTNCDEVVGHVPEGLHVVQVSTLEEAYNALVAIGAGQADSLPQCQATDK